MPRLIERSSEDDHTDCGMLAAPATSILGAVPVASPVPASPDDHVMNEKSNALNRLFTACWKDDALKAQFLSDPKAVMKEFDLEVPDGIDVKVVENTDDRVHITLPAPPAASGDLSDGELNNAAGGNSECFTPVISLVRDDC